MTALPAQAATAIGAALHRVDAFGPEHADVYEDFYRARGKDWEQEADAVAALMRERCPRARSLLDIACGTGLHLSRFQATFDHVEGVEPAPAMRQRAEGRLPEVAIHDGDMRRVALGCTFDAVTCLYTAIAYLPSVSDLRRAFAAMAAHLNPGGVLVIEPWWLPEQFLPNYVGSDLLEVGDRTIARMSHTVRDGPLARMRVQWIVGERSRGLRAFSEEEVFYMFTRDELCSALDAAGCEPELRDDWMTGRSLLLGLRR